MNFLKRLKTKRINVPKVSYHIQSQGGNETSIDIEKVEPKPLKTYRSVVLLILMILSIIALTVLFAWSIYSKKGVTAFNSHTENFDDVFFKSVYNSWRNTTHESVPGDVLEWFKSIWGPSPYLKETLEVRDKYLESISQTKIVLNNLSDKLLIGISSASFDLQRRQLVRKHQIRPYNNSLYDITWRFVLLRPRDIDREALRQENNTYGDLIILETLQDSREHSRSQKLYEYFKFVETNLSMYKYVAKLDTDCFLNVPNFYKNYFNETVQELDFAVIALFIENLGKMVWPMGAFEAISWKVMLLLNRLYETVGFSNWAEDLQLGWYLHDAELNYTKIAFPTEIAYDFRFGCNPSWFSDVVDNALRIHELKTQRDYVNVASCFNEHGINQTHLALMRASNWTV
jgi:hypothetical protein